MIALQVRKEALEELLANVLEDQGILSRIATMLQENFPATEKRQFTSPLIVNAESYILSALAYITQTYGGSEGDIKERVEKAFHALPPEYSDKIEHGIEFLKDSGYFERRHPLAVVHRALETARKQCSADEDGYPILKDLGEGVYDSYWYHNPRTPEDWGSSSNAFIMQKYRELLPTALERHGIQVSHPTLVLLLQLPSNGAQASQLVKFCIDSLARSEDGTLVEQVIKLPNILLQFAKDKSYYNARNAKGPEDFYYSCQNLW